MKNGPIALDLGALLGQSQARAEHERRAAQTPSERLAEAKESFTKLLDAALKGCQDPGHKSVEDATAAMIRGMFNFGVLPEPVANAVLAVLVSDATHQDDTGEGLKWLVEPRTITNALLIAGATLRFAQAAETAGVPVSTGNYL